MKKFICEILCKISFGTICIGACDENCCCK